jgi:hypothetical protein
MKRKEAVTLGAASLKLGQIGPSEFNFGLWLASSYIANDITDPDDKDTPLPRHRQVLCESVQNGGTRPVAPVLVIER